ncbi:MAG TPA: quinone oxidoreductase [Gammaproteobacteria bacterium]|nr:quinone oxidoreductase [Gammaproteobacteria bacterium]
MKAIRVHGYGGPDALRCDDVPTPTPGAGEALVKIAAAGVNFIDVQHREGRYKGTTLPFTVGSEGAGTVTAVGAGVTEVAVGDRVGYAMVVGSYAEYAAVPAKRLVKLPANVDFRTAAAVMLQGLTAHYLTHSTFALKRGDVALVHAAAGGAGQLVVQVARICGATVYGTVGGAAKAAIARAAGAHEVIDYKTQDFEAEVKRLTGGRGVDVVYDSVGKDTFDKSLGSLRPRGMLALFGFSSGPVAPFDPAVLGAKGSLFLTRPGLNQYIATREEFVQRAADLFKWLGSGALEPRVDRVLPLADAATAHRELEARRTTGKLLLEP